MGNNWNNKLFVAEGIITRLNFGVYLSVKIFFVLLACSGVWLLFNGLWALLFPLFYVIREFDKFLHRG